jgi:hypothetical protein
MKCLSPGRVIGSIAVGLTVLAAACSTGGAAPGAASPSGAVFPPGSTVNVTSTPSRTQSQPSPAQNASTPPADSCHSGHVTYCALSPAVTQATINRTICVAGWTATIRPPESYTENLKVQQIAAEGLSGGLSKYEEDHRMPLELGGAPRDTMNLSPEYPASPNPKDTNETRFKDEVCSGQLTLVEAQREMVAKWLAPYPEYKSPGASTPAPTQRPTTTPTPAQRSDSCRASVSNSSPPQYSDETVYVTSNVPNVAGTVDAHYKTTDHQFDIRTGSSGSAQVTFYISGATIGYRVEVDVDLSGYAACSTSFTPS